MALQLGYVDTLLHEIGVAAVQRILGAYMVEVQHIVGTRAQLEKLVTEGEIDLYISAWLPDIDVKLCGPAADMVPIGRFYNIRPALYIMSHTSTDIINGLMDIKQSAEKIDRNIAVIDWMVPLATEVLLKANFIEMGFCVTPYTEAGIVRYIESAEQQEHHRIVGLYAPHYLTANGRLLELESSSIMMGGERDNCLLFKRNVLQTLDSDMIDELDMMPFGGDVVTALQEAVRFKNMTADAAVELWQRGRLMIR